MSKPNEINNFLDRFLLAFSGTASFDGITRPRLSTYEATIPREDMEKLGTNFAKLMQSIWVIAMKTAASNNKMKFDLNNPNQKAFDGVWIKSFGGISSTTISLIIKEKMEKNGYSPNQVTLITAMVDYFMRAPTEIISQRNVAISKAKTDSTIKIPSFVNSTWAYGVGSLPFIVRSGVLWSATNQNELPWYMKAMKAAVANAALTMPVTMGSKMAFHYNQKAEQNILAACKISLQEMKWDEVGKAAQQKCWQRMLKAVPKALMESNKGIVGTSVAAGISAVVLSTEFGEAVQKSFQEASFVIKKITYEKTRPNPEMKPSEVKKTEEKISRSKS